MKVLKFGGTSVGSIKSIQTLIAIVKNKMDDQPIIVLSAMGGVTNLLAAMADHAVAGKTFTHQLEELQTRHFDIIKALLEVQRQNTVFTKLTLLFNE